MGIISRWNLFSIEESRNIFSNYIPDFLIGCANSFALGLDCEKVAEEVVVAEIFVEELTVGLWLPIALSRWPRARFVFVR